MAEGKGGTPRWRRAPEGRRGDILSASLAEFEVNGFERARMDTIAESAGLSKGSIYRYFPDKEALFAATVLAALDDSLAHFRLGSPQDPDTALRRLWQLTTDRRFAASYRLSLAHPELGSVGRDVSSRIETLLVKPFADFLHQTERDDGMSTEEALLISRLALASLLGASLLQLSTPESMSGRIAFLLRACGLDAKSPQADGF